MGQRGFAPRGSRPPRLGQIRLVAQRFEHLLVDRPSGNEVDVGHGCFWLTRWMRARHTARVRGDLRRRRAVSGLQP